MSLLLDDGLKLTAPADGRKAEILTPEALAFLELLHRQFSARRDEALTIRASKRVALAAGETALGFRADTAAIREDPSWRIAPPAPGLEDRRVELASPPTPRMAAHALGAGASVWMADLEDGTSPTWDNVIDGQVTLLDAASGRIEVQGDRATLVVRPRGLHLTEPGLTFCGRPAVAALVDFGLFLFHCARPLIDAGHGPYLYLAKLQSAEEAAWWNDVFCLAQDELGLPHGTIRATVLIETLQAAFEMEEILHALRDHASGLNAGRWDYIFSALKTLGRDRAAVLPDRSAVTMTVPFMRAYSELLVATCHKRGAHAIGGVAALLPSHDAAAQKEALAQAEADKTREAGAGFDGSWVAHPGLIETCRAAFDAVLGDRPHQLDKATDASHVDAAALLALADTPGDITLGGVRLNVAVAVRYLEAWLRGIGAVAIRGRMEDAGTAEISRVQLWQWLHHGVSTREGRIVTHDLVRQMVASECAAAKAEAGNSSTRFNEARTLLEDLVFSASPPRFFTTHASRRYLRVDD